MEKETLLNTDIHEKVEEKVETKSTNTKQPQGKVCDVLVYNSKKQTMIVCFDGLGYEFTGISKNPGKTVRVKQSGKVGTSNFKLTLV